MTITREDVERVRPKATNMFPTEKAVCDLAACVADLTAVELESAAKFIRRADSYSPVPNALRELANLKRKAGQ